MPHLKVDYSRENSFAIFTFSDDVKASLRMSIFTYCQISGLESYKRLSDFRFQMDWSDFLSICDGISERVEFEDVEFIFDDDARNKFNLAIKDREVLTESSAPSPIDASILLGTIQASHFKRNLTTEQLRNVCKLASLRGGASFSVPGAGKTTEALATYAYHSKDLDKVLIVAPKNAFISWDDQIQDCFLNPPAIYRMQGANLNVDEIDAARFLIITYQKLANEVPLLKKLLSNHRVMMILDEAHRIKGGKGRVTAEAVLSLADLVDRRLLLTGTPMPQSIEDLKPQISFLYPAYQVHNIEDPVSAISNIFVRTTKAELDEYLPSIVCEREMVKLGFDHRHLYDLVKKEEIRKLSGLNLTDRSALRRAGRSVMRLLMLAVNPSIIGKFDSDALNDLLIAACKNESPKNKRACEIARKNANNGEKTLIWTNFRQNVELITTQLKDLGAVHIHGGVDAGSDEDEETREYKIKQFNQAPDCMVMVATPAAASESISLHHGCHNAVFIDRSFNAAQYIQAQDRIHRVSNDGKNKPAVKIKFLECEDSIDQTVSKRLAEKIENMSKVLRDDSLRDMINVSLDLEEGVLDESEGLEVEDVRALIKDMAP
jgi:SNF2 family DNA or RNA helicase